MTKDEEIQNPKRLDVTNERAKVILPNGYSLYFDLEQENSIFYIHGPGKEECGVVLTNDLKEIMEML